MQLTWLELNALRDIVEAVERNIWKLPRNMPDEIFEAVERLYEVRKRQQK